MVAVEASNAIQTTDSPRLMDRPKDALMPLTLSNITQASQSDTPRKWTDADRNTLLRAASYAFPEGHTVDFGTDSEGWDLAIVTPDGAPFPVVVGWTDDGRIFVADRTIGAEEFGRTVAEAADLLRQMAAMGRI
jgi:hypothetical protein